MAQETNQTPVPMLCSTGCGFYGNPRTNGMCSICYKDFLQRQNGNGRVSPAGKILLKSVKVNSKEVNYCSKYKSQTKKRVGMKTCSHWSPPGLRLGIPEPVYASHFALEDCKPCTQFGQEGAIEPDCTNGSSQTPAEGQEKSPEKPKQRKNRCFLCQKKVGLTGFDCRCGNLFCSIHRYSDTHNCTFDYKADAAEKLRKENPVVVGEKIQKI
ncbi:ZFAN6 protein, partial [Polypterus senegalus]